MLKKPKKRFSRVLSAVLAVMIAAPNLIQLAASAEEGEKFQYTMFGRNGITMSVSSNLCMNGNLHTNKDAAITATNKNINGKLTTSADIEKRVKHVYADRKIYDTYFTTNCELHEEEYVYSDINIHINNPLYCYSNITLDGNVSLNSSIGTLMDINVTGEVKNANNSVIYSKYGNITIENDSVANVNGLIYAPLGTVTINASNVNLNGVIIADQIVINGSSVNINCNDNIARFIGTTSEYYDYSGLEYLPEEWLGDTDADDLFDIYEKVIDSDPLNPDTDGDGLPDGYEVLTLNTDPLEIDTDGNGVLDGNEDFDTDNLVNIDEYHNQTLPFTPDTDEDGIVDGDEVHIYGTIPTNPDTDADKLLDGEESYDGTIYLEYGVYFDPLNPDTDGDGINATDKYRIDMSMLEEIVRTDNKQRYSFNEDKTKIRANQGHSIQVDVELKEAEPPEVLYHGTGEKYVESILQEGLIPKSRLYVHLSKDMETAVNVGSRHGKPHIFKVRTGEMFRKGCKFWLSENGVWLTKAVPIEYLEEV